MRKISYLLAVLGLIVSVRGEACTNIIVTPGASIDGSAMVSYAADSHWLYGELYFKKAAKHAAGSFRKIVEWDSSKPLGEIPEVARTYKRVGNMNEKQVIIGETTWGGREEQMDTTGIMDYGSLIYVALERAASAREAIDIIVNLANAHGYASEGETFSIADANEAWVMDLVGKGSDGNRGIVWVARRIPDGYICAHANQARITRFPLNDPENTLYAPDVISFAREKGWFNGEDSDFSFREAYNPLDFGAARGCEARAWSAFNILSEGTFTFEENGMEVSKPANDWLDYAMGYKLKGEMPLFIKPEKKVSWRDVAGAMRDHFEGTPMDMTTDIGAGGNALPYRWRPMGFEADGKKFVNERAIATQQTGFWFVAQARAWLPDEIGALIWFGCDDAATSYLTPIYVSTKKVPECLRVGNGDLLHYSATSQFWMCNRIANACYKMYNFMASHVRGKIAAIEEEQDSLIPTIDVTAKKYYDRGRKRKARRYLTRQTLETAADLFGRWTRLEEELLVKFIDGNVKAQDAEGRFLHSKYSEGVPDGLTQPGYTDLWKRAVARDPHAPALEEK